MPALAKSCLLYQNPTTPTLYGIAYCWPFTCQPAAEPPMFLIHGATYLVRFATLCAFTWSTSWPPPQFWNTSGGLDDWSAIGILVVNCSFWIGTALTVTSGCSLWNSAATCVHSFSPAPCVALCHQTSVTDFFWAWPAARPVELVRPAPPPARIAASPSNFQIFMGSTPPSPACGRLWAAAYLRWPSASSRRECYSAPEACQPISITFSQSCTIASDVSGPDHDRGRRRGRRRLRRDRLQGHQRPLRGRRADVRARPRGDRATRLH